MNSPTDANVPIVRYSTRSAMTFDLITAIGFLLVGIFAFGPGIASSPDLVFTTPFLLSATFVYHLYTLRKRPLWEAAFFQDHFVVRGPGFDKSASYDEVQGFKKQKTLTGDFRTDSSVMFSVNGVPDLLQMPNRRNRKAGLDVYKILQERSPKTSASNV